ncbi:hypothetical protein GGF31_003187 [Allomyces arbusculus]|nr:hypothetical protein GGF31_003187 [Allomyces arbusculus]
MSTPNGGPPPQGVPLAAADVEALLSQIQPLEHARIPTPTALASQPQVAAMTAANPASRAASPLVPAPASSAAMAAAAAAAAAARPSYASVPGTVPPPHVPTAPAGMMPAGIMAAHPQAAAYPAAAAAGMYHMYNRMYAPFLMRPPPMHLAATAPQFASSAMYGIPAGASVSAAASPSLSAATPTAHPPSGLGTWSRPGSVASSPVMSPAMTATPAPPSRGTSPAVVGTPAAVAARVASPAPTMPVTIAPVPAPAPAPATAPASAAPVIPPPVVPTSTPASMPGLAAPNATLGSVINEVAPDIREKITVLWNSFSTKAISANEFLDRAHALLGPEKFKSLAAMEHLARSGPNTAVAGKPATAAARKRPGQAGPAGGTAAKKPRAVTPGATVKPPVATAPATAVASAVPTATPSSASSTPFTAPQSLGSSATSPMPGVIPGPVGRASPMVIPGTTAASTMPMAAMPMSFSTAGMTPEMYAGLAGFSYMAPPGIPPSTAGSLTTQPASASLTPSSITAAGSTIASSSAPATTKGGRKSAGDDEDQALATLGVNLEHEEEMLRTRTAGTGAPATQAAVERLHVNVPAIRARMEKIAGREGLAHVSESALQFLALALQERLRTVVTDAVHAANQRTGASLHRDLAAMGVSQPGEAPVLMTPFRIPQLAAARQADANAAVADEAPKMVAYELSLADHPESTLALLHIRDAALQVAAEEHAAMRARGLIPSAAPAAPSPTPAAVANGDAMAVDGDHASPPPPPPPPPAAPASMAASMPALSKKRERKERANIAEEARQRNANTTAFLAAGGAARSWMTMGGAGAGGPPTSSAAIAAAVPGAAPGAGVSLATAAAKRAAALVAKRRADLLGGPRAGKGQSAGAAAAAGAGVPVPGTAAAQARHKRLHVRDVLLALQCELHTGAGKFNASGTGKVAGKAWVKMREK